MEWKAPLPVGLLEHLNSEPLLAAYVEINHLKDLFRQGWLRAGIPRAECESVGDHIYSMAMLAWLVVGSGTVGEVDLNRLLRMILIHELGEIYTGDIIPSDGVSLEEKRTREREAVLQVCGKLPMGPEWLALWDEFEAGLSPEANLARQLDRLEMGLQAIVYRERGHREMGGFFHSAEQAVREPALRAWLEQ